MAAKAPDAEVKELIQKLCTAEPGIAKPAQSSAFTGSWELLWDYSVRLLCLDAHCWVTYEESA